MRFFVAAAFSTLSLAVAQVPRQKAGPATVTVRGYIDDSIAERPLPGANVQLTGMDKDNAAKRFTVESDSFGRFTIPDVPKGHYLAGFFNPALDTMGIEPHGLPVDIERDNQLIALGTPSPRSIISAACGGKPTAGFAVVLGHVREVEIDTGLAHVSVVISWTGAHEENGATSNVRRFVSVESRADGMFAACGLPGGRALSIRAIRGPGSSAYEQLVVPANELRHVTLRLPKPGGQ